MTTPPFPDEPVYLIDGDALVFRYTVANQREVDWYEGIASRYTDVNAIVAQVETYLGSIGATPANTLVMFSGARDLNFRKAVYADYKKSRSSQKPLGYAAAMDGLATRWCCLASPMLEADDLLGIFATQPDLADSAIIVAQDKDLKTVPGWHLDPFAPGKPEYFWVSRHESEQFLYFQALLGDSTDGYPGCPGIGMAGAQKILDQGADWDRVVGAFRAVKGAKAVADPEALALNQTRLARILQYGDVDWGKAEIKLWSPEEAE